jgi:hypothetical protein
VIILDAKNGFGLLNNENLLFEIFTKIPRPCIIKHNIKNDYKNLTFLIHFILYLLLNQEI